MSAARQGAHLLLSAAQALGIRVCFANPGTTELALVRALDDVPEIRPVLGLFEGVCTGAADGYARVAGIPALTLLHLGPGLANGLANLHNARRAHSPIVNIVGDHATWHLRFDAPLTSDIESLARPVSGAVIRLDSMASIIPSVNTALAHAMAPPGSVVTLIAPSDLMEASAAEMALDSPVAAAPRVAPRAVPPERIDMAATRLAARVPAVVLLGNNALTVEGQRAAAEIASLTGARLVMESYPALVSMGGDLPRLERLAYFPNDVLEQLGGATVLLAGARPPVSYFGYEGQPSELVKADRLLELSSPGEDSMLALEQLAASLSKAGRAEPLMPSGPLALRVPDLTPVEIAENLVEMIPEGAIVSLEGSTCAGPYLQRAHRARRHQVMTNTGGAIGQGIPCAVGAALAQPEARVLCLQSDGGAQYTLQALWTLAREELDVIVVICANHRYGILQTELRRAGAQIERPAARRLTRLEPPRLDWVLLARGYGVPAARAKSSAEFALALRQALAASGPHLIEAELA